jgi:hypothetical protein
LAIISIKKWWKATEIPLAETDWRNIKLYCAETQDVWDWTNCVYFVRLSPPFQIAYGKGDSPLIYIGRGAIKQRWSKHRTNWMNPLGRWLPGARYEVWLFEDDRNTEIETDGLSLFSESYGRLPLANKQGSGAWVRKHNYDESFTQVAEADRRYWWALRPTQADVRTYFDTGVAVPIEE